VKSPNVRKVQVEKVKRGERLRIPDSLIREVPLTIFVNGREYATLICTPDNLRELIYGFLHSEGIFRSARDIIEYRIDRGDYTASVRITGAKKALHEKRLITSACAAIALSRGNLKIAHLAKLPVTLRIRKEAVSEVVHQFQKECELYRSTGGVHAAALSDGKAIISLAEDVGRHNAVDKIVGWCILNSVDTQDKILLTTGRLSSEVVTKAAAARFQILISRSAPTDMAVRIAKRVNLTLIGFARGKRLNIYSASGRVI
jgi:FdhD protein